MTLSNRLRSLTTYEVDLPKKRWGGDHDGGYVVVTNLPVKYDAFISGGVAGDNSFELDALRDNPDLVCDAYDINPCPGLYHPRYHFTQAPVNLDVLKTGHVKNALVKLDIEGAEFELFEHLHPSFRRNIAMMTIEWHGVGRQDFGWGIVDEFADSHKLIWAHGNNWDELVDIDGVKVPNTLECTYVRSDLIVKDRVLLNRHSIPGPLDMPNLAHKPDMKIDWEPFVYRGG